MAVQGPSPRLRPGVRPGVRALALVLRPERDVSAELVEIVGWAARLGISLAGVEGDPRLTAPIARRPEAMLSAGCDMVLALGGDGTMLGALRLAALHGVPVLGVNLGRLGYLTEVEAARLGDALQAIGEGDFAVESRTALELITSPDPSAGLEPPTAAGPHLAFNDVVVTREPGRGQAALALSIDGELLARYASDGVIVATPPGSTAYAFAAGGPLVSPRARGMIVMPDAPHGLFNRAVVLAEGERLGIEILGRSAPVSLERDGRLLGHVQAGARFEVRARPDAVRVVRVQPGGFAERARRKLGITDPAGLADFDTAGHSR